jgi:hypothetical protein
LVILLLLASLGVDSGAIAEDYVLSDTAYADLSDAKAMVGALEQVVFPSLPPSFPPFLPRSPSVPVARPMLPDLMRSYLKGQCLRAMDISVVSYHLEPTFHVSVSTHGSCRHGSSTFCVRFGSYLTPL